MEVPCAFASLLSSVRMGPCHAQLPRASSSAPIPRPKGNAVALCCVGHQHARQGRPKVLLRADLTGAFGSPICLPLLSTRWLRSSGSAWRLLPVSKPQPEQSSSKAALPQMTREKHPHSKESSGLEKPSPPSPLSHRGLTDSGNGLLAEEAAEVGRAPHPSELLLAATAKGCHEPGAHRRADCI